MLSALARAHQVLGDAGYMAAAVRAAGFFQRVMFDEQTGRLRRSFRCVWATRARVAAAADAHGQ
jgi:hypothetical protein